MYDALIEEYTMRIADYFDLESDHSELFLRAILKDFLEKAEKANEKPRPHYTNRA